MTSRDRMQRLLPAIGFLGFGFLLTSGALWLVVRDFTTPVQVTLAIGAALTVYWVLSSLSDIREAATSRSTRYGSNTFVAVLAVILILGLANFLSSRYSTRWDLTKTGQFTLSDQTTKVISSLKDPVKITAFYQAQDGRRSETEDLMKEYLIRSPKISIDYVDPDAQPALARQLGIRVGGTLVFESGGRRTEVTSVTEQQLTSALIKVNQTEKKKIYLTTGNGELEPASTDQTGMNLAKDQLERLNYSVETLNLLAAPTVPADAAAVVIPGPRKAMSDQARVALENFATAGGHLLILVDPQQESGLDPFFNKFGLKIGNGVVVDPQSSFPGDLGVPIVQKYGFSPITRDLGQTVFPLATGILKTDNPPADLSIIPLAESTAGSWLEMNPQRAQFDEGTDIRGPIAIAMTVEKLASGTPGDTSKKLRMVVVGDSDFASNQFFNRPSPFNGDFFVNSVNWLAEEESLISISPKAPADAGRMVLTPIQQNLIVFSSVLFLPLAVLGAGATVWWQRR